MMRIVVISDTHGQHDALAIPPGDILIHAGDFTMVGDLPELKAFNAFLGELDHPHKIVIAGNHDFCFEREPNTARAKLTEALYLEDEEVLIEGIRIYGSPWQPWFFNWAFNLPRGPEIRAKWEQIPAGTDILITHGPPAGILDHTDWNEQVGCQDLLDIVQKIKPRVHIFGHIHEARGVHPTPETLFLNACVLDSSYEPAGSALILDYDPKPGGQIRRVKPEEGRA